MNIQRLVTSFTYRIEQKPGGGFIAHAGDPSLPPLEAPTRIELQQKIQDSNHAALAREFPGLQLPPNKRLEFHLERAPDGSVSFHSSDPTAPGVNPSTSEEVENHMAERLFSIFGKHLLTHLPPDFAAQLPPELIAQAGAGDMKFFVQRKVSVSTNSGSSPPSATPTPLAPPSPAPFSNSNFAVNTSDNSPITPARSNAGPIIRFLLTLLLLFGLMYFYLHFRH